MIMAIREGMCTCPYIYMYEGLEVIVKVWLLPKMTTIHSCYATVLTNLTFTYVLTFVWKRGSGCFDTITCWIYKCIMQQPCTPLIMFDFSSLGALRIWMGLFALEYAVYSYLVLTTCLALQIMLTAAKTLALFPAASRFLIADCRNIDSRGKIFVHIAHGFV